MAVSFIEIFNMVCEAAVEEHAGWKVNERIYNNIKADCAVMNELVEPLEIVSLAVSIDEHNGDGMLEYGCCNFVIERCSDHPIYSVFRHTTRFGFCKETEAADEYGEELEDTLVLRLEYGGLFAIE